MFSKKKLEFLFEMKIISGFIQYKKNKVHCVKMGEGSQLMIAFHGFSNDYSIFLPLAELLQKTYTIIAIDLPGHGLTEWQDKYFDEAALMALIQGFKNDLHVDKIAVMGYSLGGRMALMALEKQANWISNCFLFAADGLTKNIPYRIATRSFWGKLMFDYVSQKPKSFLSVVDRLKKMNVINGGLQKFVHNNLNDESVRKQANYVWHVTSRIIPHKSIIQYQLKRNETDLYIISGAFDQVMTVASATQFSKGLSHTTLQTLQCGHLFPEGENLQRLVSIILSAT